MRSRMSKVFSLVSALALVLFAATGSAEKLGTRRIVHPNTDGGMDSVTKWTAKGTTFVHLKRTNKFGGVTHTRFAHKAGDTRRIHMTSRSQGHTTKGKSWLMANGVIGEHLVRAVHCNGVRVKERSTTGKRNYTMIWSNSVGDRGKNREWNLNQRQKGVYDDGLRTIDQGQVGKPQIRMRYDDLNALFK